MTKPREFSAFTHQLLASEEIRVYTKKEWGEAFQTILHTWSDCHVCVDDVGIPALFEQCEANPASRMTTGLRASCELNDTMSEH